MVKKKEVGMCTCVYRERKDKLDVILKNLMERFQFIVLSLQLFCQVEII